MLKNFNFIKNKNITLIIIAVCVVIGIGSMIIRGFVIDIDFKGGTEFQVNIGSEVTEAICTDLSDTIKEKLPDVNISSVVMSTIDNNIAIIRTSTLNPENKATLNTALSEKYPDIIFSEYRSVSPSIGEDLTKTAIYAVLLAIVLIVIYIGIRFEPVTGFCAIICLINDLFIMIAFYSLFQVPINSNFIATTLTILGYSLDATIIVFDRIRENHKKFGDTKPFVDTVDLSVHQTLTRSINTTFTTFVTVLIVYIFGVDSIRNFALPLLVGILAGLFSSIFLSGVLWVYGAKLFKKKEKVKATK